jgi:hypothetical protein
MRGTKTIIASACLPDCYNKLFIGGMSFMPAALRRGCQAGMLPVRASLSVQAGVKNLLDRNYFYWAGFPEEGRNWYLTLRCTF